LIATTIKIRASDDICCSSLRHCFYLTMSEG
jgi:hypothetical protein